MTFHSVGLACSLALSLALASLLLPGCTPAERQQGAQAVAHALTFGADVCEAILRAKGRDDLAAYCRATHDGAVVLDKATEPPVCAMPDAGAGEAGSGEAGDQ